MADPFLDGAQKLAYLILAGDVFGIREVVNAATIKDMRIPGSYMARDRTFTNLPPLHFAILHQQVAVVHHFLSISISPDTKSWEGMTPLHLAVFLGLVEYVEVLLFFRADTRLLDKFGQSALSSAVVNGNVPIVRALLEAGAMDKDDPTALHLAIATEQLEIVSLIVSFGGNPQAKSKVGRTAFDLLRLPEQKSIEDVLRGEGPKDPGNEPAVVPQSLAHMIDMMGTAEDRSASAPVPVTHIV